MKITDVKVEVIHIPMKKPFRIAFAVQDHSVNVLVKVMTDEGIYGIGEAAPFEPVTGENSATVLEVLKLFKQGLIGMDPMNIEGIHLMMDRLISGNTSAKAAIDIALYDLKGKVMNQPLYKVLGGYRDQIVTDMTIGIDKPELMAQEAKERVERDGFRILKVKVFCSVAQSGSNFFQSARVPSSLTIVTEIRPLSAGYPVAGSMM